jgi:tol-pal system protein YbgF
MRRQYVAGALVGFALLLARCATGGGAAPAPTPPPVAASDPHQDDLQRSVTELADRLEVMSDRLQRLEVAAESPSRTAAASSLSVGERSVAAEVPAVLPKGAKSAAPPSTPQTTVSTHSAPRTSAAHALGGPALEDKYRRALTLYGQGKTAEARLAFQDVFDSDPAGELADNALYWLGETFFASGNYSNALTYYQRVVKDYSDQNKAPDALFKSGMAYEKMGDLQLARRAFDDCIARYPYSTPAASARMELKRIKY